VNAALHLYSTICKPSGTSDNSRYVYIVSSPHGGSTLFSYVIGKHPQAQNLGEVSFIPKLLALGEACSCGKPMRDCKFWGEILTEYKKITGVDLRAQPYGVPLGDAPKAKSGAGLIDHRHQTRLRYALMKVRGALDTVSVLHAPKGAGLRRFSLPSVTRGVDNTVALYRTAARSTGARLIVDASKLPRKAAHLYVADPDRVRIVHLTRDGRGVVASRKRYMDVGVAAERWNHYHRLATRLLERWVPDACRMRLSYEDFVTQPETVLRRVFDWLEMDYSAESLRFGSDAEVHSAGGNPARFEMDGGIRGVDERWRSTLTERELHEFERRAGALNRRFGYG
jgi:hypothetical protein